MSLLTPKEFKKLAGDVDASPAAIQAALGAATAAVTAHTGITPEAGLVRYDLRVDPNGFILIPDEGVGYQGELDVQEDGRVYVGHGMRGAVVSVECEVGGEQGDTVKEIVASAAKRFLDPKRYPQVRGAVNTDAEVPVFNEGFDSSVLLTETERKTLEGLYAPGEDADVVSTTPILEGGDPADEGPTVSTHPDQVEGA